MANRYNAWVSTRPIQLPTDTYMQVGQAAEGRAEAYTQQLTDSFAKLGQIDPFSKDAEAVYTRAMDKLRAGISEIAKMKLNTPEAYRKFTGLTSNQEIMKPIMQVYYDKLYGDKAIKTLTEYRAKNPDNNAVPYLQLIDKVGRETGNAENFDPYRFKHLSAIPEYFDYWKLVSDEVSKLKEDSNTVQRIMGDKYKLYEKAGVLEDRIRDLATQRVMNDPQARAQFQRDIHYRAYLTNPQDVNQGYRDMAGSYREAILGQAAEREKGFEEFRAKIMKEKNNPVTGKPFTKDSREKFIQDAKVLIDKTVSGYRDMANKPDNELIMESALNAFAGSFKGYANTKTVDKEWLNPMAIARYSADRADARVRLSHKLKSQEMNEALRSMHTRNTGLLQQQEITPENKNEWIKTQLPDDLPSVRVDKHGYFNLDAYKGIGIVVPKQSEAQANANPLVAAGILEVRPAKPRAGGPLHGVSPHDPKSSKLMYDKAVGEIKSYVERAGFGSAKYTKNGTFDAQTALNDIIKFRQATESAYMTPHSLPAGNTNEFRDRVASTFGFQKVYDATGREVDVNRDKIKIGDKEMTILEAYNSQKPVIHGAPSDLKTKQPMFVFSIGNKSFKTAMDPDLQSVIRPATDMINATVNGKTGITQYGNDLAISKMAPGGQMANMYIPGGNDPLYQKEAKDLYDRNVDKLVKETGMNKADASAYLRNNYLNIYESVALNKTPFVVTNPATGKTTTLTSAVYNEPDRGIYYTDAVPGVRYDNTGRISRTNIESIGDNIYKQMEYFGGNNNPFIQYYNRQLFNKGPFQELQNGSYPIEDSGGDALLQSLISNLDQ